MTVASTTNRKTYTGDNVSTSFDTSPVIFYLSSNLQVRVTVIATGVSTLLTENTHYTVSGGSASGATGAVNLAGGSSPHGALLSTEKLVILRVLPLTQASDFVENSNSSAEVVEAALDRLTDVDQQLSERQDRALTFPEGDVSGSTTTLQDASVRAGRLLGFDALGVLTTLIVQAGTSLVDLAASTGASLIGFIQTGTGAVLRTLLSKLRDDISVFDYMSATQVSDVQGAHAQDHTAPMLLAFAAASGRRLLISAGTYNFNPSAGITTLGCILYGDGRGKTIIKITGNGDIFQRSSASVLRDLTIDLVGATYSGHGCRFAAATSDQCDYNIEIKNAASLKQALLFEADGGSEFHSFGSSYYTLGAVGVVAAVKVNGTDSSAVPRKFYGVISSGCTLFDFQGANNFFASGFYTNGLIFGAGSSHVMLNNFRNGAAGGTVTIKGSQHVISGISAASIVNQATSAILAVQAPSWDITDTGTGNSILHLGTTYTPTWTGASANPVLGNGVLKGRYSREGNKVSVEVDLTMGSTTTYGTGAWYFSLPQLDDSGIVQVCGMGMANAAGGASLSLCTVRVEPGLQKCSMFNSAFANIGAAIPGAWANGDTLRISLSYFCT